VGFDENDEPFIVKAAVVQKSPVPVWLATVVVILACFTFAQGFYFNVQRINDLKCSKSRDYALTVQIKARLDTSDRDRALLKDVVQEVLAAKDNATVQRTLSLYIQRSDALDTEVIKQRAVLDQLLKEKCG
jgi:hypothetical protein